MMLTQTPLKQFAVLPKPSKRVSLRQTARMALEPKETSSGQDSYSVKLRNFTACYFFPELGMPITFVRNQIAVVKKIYT